VPCLVGDRLLLSDFGPYGIIFRNVRVITTVAMIWPSFVVEESWLLWDNTIKVAIVMEAYYVYVGYFCHGILYSSTSTQRSSYNLDTRSYLRLRYIKSHYVT
jgi:hypothetical protein